MHEILNFPFCCDKTLLFYAEIKICTILNFYDIKQQITYLKQIDPDLKIFSPNPFYTNESLSRTDFLRTVRYPERYPSMQWSLLLLFLVENVRKKIYQSKSIPDVHKFVLRSKILCRFTYKILCERDQFQQAKIFHKFSTQVQRWPTQLKNIYQLLKYISAAQLGRHKIQYSDSD